MTRMWTPGGDTRRPLAPRVATPREPVAPPASAAPSYGAGRRAWTPAPSRRPSMEARFDARQDSRHEDLADDVRGRAELAEWARLAQLLVAAAPGTGYDLDTDDSRGFAPAATRQPPQQGPPPLRDLWKR
ncbi:hypothetical protein OIE62_00040 [Streptomyces scopuliridis]|uniref:Uncharacterized protein n=1 Tax=Streptomyces scopuliridis TaxID=452529 RepID=A0ACD4ZXC1_9ACTN|nr:hypothetical protein [Streptomyces scopuliridis]WSC02860.1 hypothetical protein OG835_41790 [Streptomyces scopuliridis]WSC03605.1 hypothetical protein OIE62_00040 [Streptomyces scopuliridis]